MEDFPAVTFSKYFRSTSKHLHATQKRNIAFLHFDTGFGRDNHCSGTAKCRPAQKASYKMFQSHSIFTLCSSLKYYYRRSFALQSLIYFWLVVTF